MVSLRTHEQPTKAIGQVMKHVGLLGDVVALHEQLGLRRAEGPFDRIFPLHLGNDFVVLPFGG